MYINNDFVGYNSDSYGLNETQLNETWTSYKASGDVFSRNRLVEHYLPLAHRIASKESRKLPSSVDVDDLRTAATFGLLDSIDRFDLDKGIKFRTYATQRISGAVKDSLRATDLVPRSVRQKSKCLRQATEELEALLGREPSDTQLADHLDMTIPELDRLVRGANAKQYMSLSETVTSSAGDEALTTGDVIADDNAEDPFEKAALKDQIADVMNMTDERERVILMLYFYEDLTLKEIGFTMNISESRVSQLLKRLLKKIRDNLN